MRTGSWGLVFLLAVVAAGCGGADGGGGSDGTTEEGLRYRSQTRTYYIAAVEEDWDYAPAGMNVFTGEAFDDDANVFVENGPDRIGSVYRKSLYREFTDATFTTRAPRDPGWEHLGYLGPVIRGVVGDTIVVEFKNLTAYPASVHPHGVLYAKDSEGAPYDDGTSGTDKDDDIVPPGGTHTYTWGVPERAGPGPHDGSSKGWMYHSHVDEVADTNAGLVGPLIITARDRARRDGTPKDVDRELVTVFTVLDENASLHLDTNIATFPTDPGSVDPEDEGFGESNLMHAVNGYVYGNIPGLDTTQGERVRWYVYGIGNEVDLHTPHWHGQTVLSEGMRMDMVDLLPMSMVVADMVPDAPGTWAYHCHVNDHLLAGMLALYTVAPAP